jgi:hypothetical protein
MKNEGREKSKERKGKEERAKRGAGSCSTV